MVKFYPLARSLALVFLVAGTAAAQTPAGAQAEPAAPQSDTVRALPPVLIGGSIPAGVLDDLPASGNLLSLIDATSADVITDRVDTGGLSVGDAARLGGHGSSWTQTRFLLDGVDFTDPDGSGSPLLIPGVLEWQRVDVLTGAMPIDVNAAGLAVSLTPRRPTAEWTRRVDLIGAPPVFVSDPFLTTAPTLSRLNSYGNGSFLASGPIVPGKLGIVVAASWLASTRFDRSDPTELSSTDGSFFTHLVFTPDPASELRVIGWAQHTDAPFANRLAFEQPAASQTGNAVHGQATFDRKVRPTQILSAFASYGVRQRTLGTQPTTSIFFDRIFDGPMSALLYPGDGTDAAWSGGVRLRPVADGRTGWDGVRLGADVSGGSATMRPAFAGLAGELVNGVPARVWSVSNPANASSWSDTTVAVYASDRFELLPRVAIDVGARFETVNGSAAGSADSISWHNFLPRAAFRWNIVDWKDISFFANYSRNAYALPLTDLAWNDPNAPTATVYRWNATTPQAPTVGELGAPIQQMGPGTGANLLTSIDPALARPYMDEVTFGFQGRPNASTTVRLSAIARREQQLLGVVDTGVPASAYTKSAVPDPGLDLASTADDQLLPVYGRPAGAYGLDRYVLTNPADDEATLVGVDVDIESHTDRMYFVLAGTASRSEGIAANRGFLATENDEGLLGEVYIDPNARTFAQGRLFTERGYTIKTSGTYHFDHDIRLGVAARYQDGQHFARLVIAPELPQGPEAIRAFRNGRTRFTYTMTVDARLQKGFVVGGVPFTAMLDAYNLFNQHTEIEEFPVSGPLSRTTTAIQPPRALHVGVRVAF